jgi:hypothetical protein
MKFIEALAAILNAVAALVNNGESFSQKHLLVNQTITPFS